MLAITADPFNAGNVQTCTYGYDDLARIASANCGSHWSQTFSYDPFGNITKSGSLNWQPGYNSGTNRYTLTGTSYDANGNLLNDTFHTYSWDALGRPVSIGGKAMTYDALGRMVEKQDGSSFTQFVYNPTGGLFARTSGQSATSVRVPLPGAWAVYGSSGTFNHYEHLDWLGNSRLSSTQSHGITSDIAYAPFGEPYASTATSGVSFTGMRSDVTAVSGGVTSGLYDFLEREYPPTQGRWLSPDPAGLAAVDPTDPQTWNRYAYVGNNPSSFTDPLGLDSGCGGPTVGVSHTINGTPDSSGYTQSYPPCNFGMGWGYYWDMYSPGYYYLTPGSSSTVSTCLAGAGPLAAGQTRCGAANNSTTCPAVPHAPPGANVNNNIHTAKWMKMFTYTDPVSSLYAFKKVVENKGPWDYKQQGWTLTDTGNLGPSPFQDFGNFNFGASGAAWGIPLNVLQRGAGWGQGQAGTSTPEWGRWYQGPPYGDDPADQAQIGAGYRYYQNGCYKKN